MLIIHLISLVASIIIIFSGAYCWLSMLIAYVEEKRLERQDRKKQEEEVRKKILKSLF